MYLFLYTMTLVYDFLTFPYFHCLLHVYIECKYV